MKRMTCVFCALMICLSFVVAVNTAAYDETSSVIGENISITASEISDGYTSSEPEKHAPDIVSVDGKKIMVVGNSMLYFGNYVIKSNQGKADSGYLYQLIKAGGENATVIDHTYPGKTLDYIYENYLSKMTKHELESFDYVVLSEAARANEDLVKTCKRIKALFPEDTQFRFMCHPMMYDKGITSLIDGVQKLRQEGMQIVDWGRMVYDVYTKKVQVPWAESEFDRCTFIKDNPGYKNGKGSISPGIKGDEKHPNPLSGYIAAQMLYSSITNRCATLNSYEFCFDNTIHAYYDIDAFAKAHYNGEKKTNFTDVFRNKKDMFGLQILMDAYLEAEGWHPLVEEPSIESTCTTVGLIGGRYCSVCSLVAKPSQIIPDKAGHKLSYCTAVEATCTKSGATAGIYCSECDATIIGIRTTQPKGHLFTKYISDNNATYFSDGTKTAKCKNCTDEKTQTDKGSKLVVGKTKVTASAGAKSVTLKWNKVSDATGYRVYIYRAGAWKKLKDVTALSYKVTDLKSLTTYRFSVRAFVRKNKKYARAPEGARVAVTTLLPDVSIKLSTPSKSKLKISWKDIKGEQGYQIWYSTSKNGTYKKYANCKANSGSYTISGLKKGKTYYIKLRAYTKLDSKYVYSRYSAVKSVKIK